MEFLFVGFRKFNKCIFDISQADKDLPILQTGELFSPAPNKKPDIFSVPMSRAPLQNEEYILEQTPFINNLRIAMEQALNRPITYYNSQRHTLMVKYVELIFLPIILVRKAETLVTLYEIVSVLCLVYQSCLLVTVACSPCKSCTTGLFTSLGLMWTMD